jgi:hypothetical protein
MVAGTGHQVRKYDIDQIQSTPLMLVALQQHAQATACRAVLLSSTRSTTQKSASCSMILYVSTHATLDDHSSQLHIDTSLPACSTDAGLPCIMLFSVVSVGPSKAHSLCALTCTQKTSSIQKLEATNFESSSLTKPQHAAAC